MSTFLSSASADDGAKPVGPSTHHNATASAAKPPLAALAHDLQSLSFDSLVERLRALNPDDDKSREDEALSMLESGLALCSIKETLKHGEFLPSLERVGFAGTMSSRYMQVARMFLNNVPETMQPKFLALGKSRLLELVKLDADVIEELAQTGECGGVQLDDLGGMTIAEIRLAVMELAEHFARRSRIDSQSPRREGGRIKSLYAGRPGTVVKVYPDGSACIRWDDGEPQAAGLGHERIPRDLLIQVADVGRDTERHFAPSIADSADIDTAKIVSFALAARKAYSPPRGPDPHQVASVEKRKAYCAELLQTMLHYADEADLGELEQALEEQVTEISSQRHVPGLIAARYELFCRFWVAGGAK